MNKKIKKPDAISPIKTLITISILFSLIIISASPALAHKVYLFAWTEGDTVYTDSYFSSNKKVQDGTITVFDGDREIMQGKIDGKGEFSFKIPKGTTAANLKLILESSMGHRAEYLLPSENTTGNGAETEQDTDIIKSHKTTALKETADITAIKKALEQVLDARLKPISKGVAKLQEERGPGLTEIFGGIGYIIGIAGIAMYFRSRKIN